MPSWSSNVAVTTNAPKNKIHTNVKVNQTANMISNTTPSAMVNNMVVGLYGVSQVQAAAANTHNNKNVVPGWYLVRSGMGPVLSFNGLPIGSGYSNNDQVKLTANGSTNTIANVVTNSTGGVISLTNLTAGGGLFPNSSFITVAIANTTGGAANGSGFTGVTAVLGGRAGRVWKECLVVLPSATSNSTYSTTAFPNS